MQQDLIQFDVDPLRIHTNHRTGEQSDIRWTIAALIGERPDRYISGYSELLDPRPITEIAKILKQYWRNPKDVVKLVSNGSITHLGRSLKETTFAGNVVAIHSNPRNILHGVNECARNRHICFDEKFHDWYSNVDIFPKPKASAITISVPQV